MEFAWDPVQGFYYVCLILSRSNIEKSRLYNLPISELIEGKKKTLLGIIVNEMKDLSDLFVAQF